MYQPDENTTNRINNNFTHHSPKGTQTLRYESVRSMTRTLASALVTQCPPSRELSVALTKLEEVMFWANAAIARNE